MSDSPFAISPRELAAQIGTPGAPWVVDVRRHEAFQASERVVAGALWRGHKEAADWANDLPAGPLVAYCVHGHQVSQIAAALLRSAGRSARYLDGGIEGFIESGGATVRRIAVSDGGHWVTADRLSRDRLACAWLLRRFIDPLGQIHLIDAAWAEPAAGEVEATTFALNDEESAFDSMLETFDLRTPSLDGVADALAGRSEIGVGLNEILEGLLCLHGPGEALFTQSAAVFDAVYARQ